MRALDAHQARDLARGVRAANVARRVGESEVVRVRVEHLAGDVDLLERVADAVRGRGEVGRLVPAGIARALRRSVHAERDRTHVDEDRPEHAARTARPQPRDVDMLHAVLPQVYRGQIESVALAEGNGRIDVRIDCARQLVVNHVHAATSAMSTRSATYLA